MIQMTKINFRIRTILLIILIIFAALNIYQERKLYFNFDYSILTISIFLNTLFITILAIKTVFSHVEKEYKKSSKLTRRSGYLQIFVFASLALLINIPFFFTDWPRIHVGLISFFSSIILMIMGAIITLFSMGLLGSWLKVIGNETNILNTTGFYKYSRNPQLLGYCDFFKSNTTIERMTEKVCQCNETNEY